MRRASTRMDYATRIDEVVAYMGEHCGRDLQLDQLAAVACFSRYHFHRLYRQLQGETPDQTLRRMRLHRAAAALIHGDSPISDIAQQARYGSLEAFSRAFSAAYGQSPSAFRNQRQSLEAFEPRVAAPMNQENNGMFPIEIQDHEALTVCGLDHRGDYNRIGTVFERVCAQAGAHGLMGPETRSIGIYFDDPDSVPTDQLRAFAGIVLPAGHRVPDGLATMEIAAGRVARMVFKGPYADLHQAYRVIYGQWLPDSGHEPADQPAFEEYLNDCRHLPPTEWLTAIMVPLAV